MSLRGQTRHADRWTLPSGALPQRMHRQLPRGQPRRQRQRIGNTETFEGSPGDPSHGQPAG